MKTPKRKLQVNGINDALKQLRAALDKIDVVTRERDEAVRLRMEAAAARRTAEETVIKTREHFNDLKERLHNAEMETSRLNGYMQRVREDDNVADPLVPVTDGSGTRQVSKRWPSNGMANSYGLQNAGCDYQHQAYGETKKREHWITY